MTEDNAELMADPVQVLTAAWKPIETAPKDGTWILLRGRNSMDKPMVPVVAAWRTVERRFANNSYYVCSWWDSANLMDLTSLAATPGADWMSLPQDV